MDKLSDVWSTRDFPVLREAVRLIDSGEDAHPRLEQLAEACGLSEDDTERALQALTRRRLIDPAESASGPYGVDDVSGEAYLITGLHPDGDDLVSQLIATLRQAADQTDDPEEKSRLRRMGDSASDVGRQTLGAVLAALVTGGLA